MSSNLISASAPLLDFLKNKLTTKDKEYFSNGSSELHPPSSYRIDDLWRPLECGRFSNPADLLALENIYFLLRDDGFSNKYRNLYITSIYVFSSQDRESNFHYLSNFVFNAVVSIIGDQQAIDHFFLFVERIVGDGEKLAVESKFFLKMTMYVLSGADRASGSEVRSKLETLYEAAFDRLVDDVAENFWGVFNPKDRDWLKEYFLEWF